MERKENSTVFQLHPEDAKAQAIAGMCDPHCISVNAVPGDLSLVPAAIAEILKNRPTWDMDRSWGRGR